MFLETIQVFPGIVNFSISNLLKRALSQILIIVLMLIFAYKKTIITSLSLIIGLIYHFLGLKLDRIEKQDLNDCKIRFKSPEKRILKLMAILATCWILIKLLILTLVIIPKKKITNKIYERDYINLWLTFLFEGESSRLIDFLFGCYFVIILWVFVIINEKTQNYIDRVGLSIWKKLINKVTIFMAYLLLYGLIIVKITWNEKWSILEFLENITILIIMIACFLAYQISRNLTLERYLNFHKYLCLLKLILVSVYFIFFNLAEKFSNLKKFANYFEEIGSMKESFDFRFILLCALYLAHSLLNFLTKFRSRFIEFPRQKIDKDLLIKPYSLLFINYFSKNLIQILKIDDIQNHLNRNFVLNFDFYKDLMKHLYFKKQFEYSVKSHLFESRLRFKFQFYDFILKVGSILNAYKYDLIRIGLNIGIIVYFSSFFGEMNILCPFYLVSACTILIYRSFKTISYTVFIFSIMPTLLVVLLFGFHSIFNKNGSYFEFGSLNTFLNFCGFAFDSESLKLFLKKEINFIGIGTLYLILLCLINSKTEKQKDVSPIQFLKNKRFVILNTDEDLVFIGKQICLLIFLFGKYYLLVLIIIELLTFVNFLNTIEFVFLIIYILFHSKKTFSIFCEVKLFVFIFRFVYSHIRNNWDISGEHKFFFGYFFNDIFAYGRYNLEEILADQNRLLVLNFFVVCFFFGLRRIFEGLADSPIETKKTFKTKRLSSLYNYFIDLIADSKQFVYSMKIFLLYFYTFRISKTVAIAGTFIFEYFFTMIVLVSHIFVLKNPGKLQNFFFFGLFAIYASFIFGIFSYNYETIFILNYRDIGSASLEQSYNDFEVRSSFEILLPSVIKMIVSLICLKDIYTNLFLGVQEYSQTTAFSKITKEKFYFSALKFFSVFFKEVFLVFLIKDFLTPPNLTKLIYLCLYMHYFNSQFKSLSKILKKFYFIQILQAKIHYYKDSLLNPKFESIYSKIDTSDSIFEDIEIVYYKLFTRKIYNTFYKKVDKVWGLMFILILTYMSLLFFIREGGVYFIRDFQIVRMLISFWEDNNAINQEYSKIIYIFGITVLETFFINILKSNWDSENKEMLRLIPKTILQKYIKILSDNPQLLKLLRVEPKELENFEESVILLKLKEFSKYNYQIEKYRSSTESRVIDNLKKKLTKTEKFILILNNRSKHSILQILMGLIFSFRRFILLPFLIGLMNEPCSLFSLFVISIIVVSFLNLEFSNFIRITNICITILCFAEYFFFVLFENGIFYKSGEKNLFSSFFWGFKNSSFSGLRISLLYIVLIKIFYLTMIFFSLVIFIKIDRIPLEYWSKIHKMTIKGLTYHIFNYKNWNFWIYEFFHSLKRFVFIYLADVFYILTLINYYHLSGILASLLLTVFVIMKVFVIFKWNKPLNDSVSIEYFKQYQCLAVINATAMLILHFNKAFRFIIFNTSDSFLFPLTLVLNYIILDCINSFEFQNEKLKISNFLKIKLQLKIFNTIYMNNEKDIIACAKHEMTDQHLKARTDKMFEKRTQMEEDNCEPENLTNLSLFSKSTKYYAYLKEKLGFLKFQQISLAFFIQKQIVKHNSISNDIFALLNSFISKNLCFVSQNYTLDYCQILNDEFGEVEKIMEEIENNKNLKFKENGRNLISIVKSKLEKLSNNESPYPRQTTKRFISAPMSPSINPNLIQNISREFLKKLTRNVLEEQFGEANKNQFGKNFFKFKMTKSEFLIIRNFDEIDNYFAGLNSCDLNFKDNLRLAIKSLISRIELLGPIWLVVLFCFNQGFLSEIYIFILIFGIVIENKVRNVKMWRFFYLFYQINLLIIMAIINNFDLMNYQTHSNSIDSKYFPSSFLGKMLVFFYGKVNTSYLLFCFTIIEILFLVLNDNDFWDKNVNQIENKSQALYRLSLSQNGLFDIFNRENQIMISKINTMEFHLKNCLKETLSEYDYTKALVNLGKQKSILYRLSKEKYSKFLNYVDKLSVAFKADTNFHHNQNFESYLWRNFSYTHRKTPQNYHKFLSAVLLIFLVYFFVFYFKIIGSNKSLNEILKNNEIHATLGVNISIVFLAICIERYVYFNKRFFWIEPCENKFDVIRRYLANLNLNAIEFGSNTREKRNLFIKAVNRLIYIKRMAKPSIDNFYSDYKYNPMIGRLIFTLIFFVYLNVLVFIIIPITSNATLADSLIDSVFCNSYYRTADYKNDFKYDCNLFSINVYLQILLLIGNLYVLLSVYQIKNGISSRLFFKPNNFTSLKEKMKFYVNKYSPFVRELKTILDFASSRSSLDLFQWFRIEDIKKTLLNARLNQENNKFSTRRINKLTKRLTGFLFIGFFFILLIGPLYLFSDYLFNSKMDQIISANLLVKIKSRGANYSLYHNHGFIVERLTKNLNIFKQIYKNESLKKFDSDSFQSIIFGSNYNSYNSITRETANNIKQDLEKDGFINFVINLTLETIYRGRIEIAFNFKLKNGNAKKFLRFIQNERCADITSTRMNIGASPKLLNLRTFEENKPQEINENEFSNLENFYVLIFRCDEETNRIVFELTEESNERFEFIVLNKNIKNSVTVLQNFTDDKISLKYIYIIIFTYIGLTLIRNALFAQAHLIWTTELPNSYKLEEFLYLILYARLKGNLSIEKRIFTKLIDLYRAPEKIKKLTGSYLDHLRKTVQK